MNKKLYLSILLTSFFITSMAQVTINNLSISIGDSVIMEKDTNISLNVNLSNTGSGQAWDYSNLQSHVKDTTLLESPASGLLNSNFTSAEMMVHDEDSTWIYIDKGFGGISILGFVEIENSGDTVIRDWNIPFIGFPSTLGRTETSNASFIGYQDTLNINPDSAGGHPFVDSIRFRYDLTFHADIDAEGVLTLPTGDFNVLRQINWQEHIIHFEMYVNGGWEYCSDTLQSLYNNDSLTTDSTEYEIRFWTNDPAANFFICSYSLDSTLSTNQDRVEWKNISPTPNSILDESELIAKIYPIPAQNNVVLSIKEFNSNMSYEIITVSGEKVSSGKIDNRLQTIDVNDLNKGVYLLKINSNDKSEFVKLAIK